MGPIVPTLLTWTRPHVAVFGQKDALQSVLVRRLADEFFMDTHIVVHPTAREHDGLAYSSRNTRLTPEERARAPHVYRTLQAIQRAFERGERDTAALRRVGERYGQENAVEIEYISLADAQTAVRFGAIPKVRRERGRHASRRRRIPPLAHVRSVPFVCVSSASVARRSPDRQRGALSTDIAADARQAGASASIDEMLALHASSGPQM